jgi:hypothetical protein
MSLVRTTRVALALAGLVALSACSIFSSEYPNKQAGDDNNPHPWNSLKNDNVFGEGGISILGWGGSDDKNGTAAPPAIGINAYLWRASLDTLAFLPLASADPFGGTIITDWYAPPESPNERFKMSVYITDRDLHADGIHVSVFRQTRPDTAGAWTDATVTAKTSVEVENAILTRARELRSSAATVKKND